MLSAFQAVSHVLQANPILSFGLILGAAVTLAVRYQRSPWRKLPPGPRGLPLLGNLFDIPRKAAWKTFAEWGNAYGELTLFVQPQSPPDVL